jgi:hypothetical protein
MSGKLKIEFTAADGSQYDDNAALVNYGGGTDGGKLWIGDRFSASYVQLKARKCKTVCVCDEDMYGFAKEAEVTYQKIDPSDDQDHFQESFDFIERHLAKKRSIIVHDEAGVGKAAVIIIYFLMIKSKKSLGEAYKYVGKLRGELKVRNSKTHTLLSLSR